MRIRLKTKWNTQTREVSLTDTVSVLAFNAWKIGMQALLEIENQNFQTDTQLQRMAIIEEVMVFLVHILDRIAYSELEPADRQPLLSSFALKIADHIQDNTRDFAGQGDYRNPFITKLNSRLAEYAETSWDQAAQLPGFSMGLSFGQYIATSLGPRDQQWVLDYIQLTLMPEILEPYKRVLIRLGLLSTSV